ncbi:hypothetical protein [Chromohalobacter canadensis]|nr:hypothetical protein [Chromohalobacter canadensis]
MGECEKCGDQAIGFNDDGDLLCEDCIFEQTCEELFGDEWGGDE